MFVVGSASLIKMEELALASFSACWAGELVFNTWGAVLKRMEHIRAVQKQSLQSRNPCILTEQLLCPEPVSDAVVSG